MSKKRKKEEHLECIVHYDGYDKYSGLKQISEINENRIREAKLLREETGGLNHHQEQCSKIPDAFDQNLHGIHLTPCYKKFTLMLSSVKKSQI